MVHRERFTDEVTMVAGRSVIDGRGRRRDNHAGDFSPLAMAGRTEPRTFGKYQTIATLGRGGMADVFLAALVGPAGFNKLQVIKCLRPNLAEEAGIKAMFLDEARLAARLNHRNVVQTNEVGEMDGAYFIAMEYLDGQPLNRVLRQLETPLPLPVSLRILSDALAGLHHAHELVDYDGTPLRIVHRDVSTHNVFVTYDGQVKIVDFGVAKAERRAAQTDIGVVKGKIQYMAPEQAYASSRVDRRADVFSIGAILWELIAGRRLWHELGTPEILAGMAEGIPSIRSVVPDVDPELARICDKALAFRVEDRYASAADLRADLDRLGLNASADEVGALVGSLFVAERAEMRAVIEKQIGGLSGGDLAAVLDLGPASTATPVGAPRSETPGPSTRASTDARPRRRGRGAAAAVLAVAAFAGGYLFLAPMYARRFAARTAAAPEAPLAAPSAVTPAPSSLPAPASTTAAPDTATIRLHVTVNPSNATVLVDGKPLPSNPFDGRVPRDGRRHKVQIDADGFSRALRVPVFDRDVEISSTLRPLGAAGSPLQENDRK
jgi:serine/threonine-protein kinase